jgi:hypothetical protein
MKDTEKPYFKIIKYINYQKIYVNMDIIIDIRKVISSKINISNLENISLNQLKRIKKYIKLFDQQEYQIEYYIFILEILPDYLIRNIYRTLSYKWNRNYNENKDICNIRLLNKINKIDTTKKIKDLLLNELEYLKKNNEKSINFFINCLNDFFI